MFIKVLVAFSDYFMIPASMWSLCALGGLGRKGYEDSLFPYAAILVVAALYSHQVGYRRYYASGRKQYFYAVFCFPFVLGVVALLVKELLIHGYSVSM